MAEAKAGMSSLRDPSINTNRLAARAPHERSDFVAPRYRIVS